MLLWISIKVHYIFETDFKETKIDGISSIDFGIWDSDRVWVYTDNVYNKMKSGKISAIIYNDKYRIDHYKMLFSTNWNSQIKMNAFIFHGVYGHSNENWFPWLKDKLEDNSIKTTTLNFPTPVDQTLNNWMKVVAPYKDKIGINTIIIGHSLGTLFSAHLLSTITEKVKGVFLIAPFTGLTNDKEINKTIASFIDTPVDWDKVCKKSCYTSIYASLDDPYIPLESSIEFARNIGLGKLNLYLNAGHFNQKANMLKFPDLLDEILRIKHPPFRE